jgi:ATP-dependent DNA helicase PIF1
MAFARLKDRRLFHSMKLHPADLKHDRKINSGGSKLVFSLNAKQRQCAELIARGENVLVTGPAGTGKSYLLQYLKTEYPSMPVTGSTGIAALSVGGCTLHSWAGIGIDPSVTAEKIAAKHMERKNSVWFCMKTAERLAIDEVSMTDAPLMDKLSRVLQIVRRSQAPFGGIQLICFGDFLQLPPVGERGQPVKFAFESKAWQAAKIHVLVLDQVMRQKDAHFAGILSRVRVGDSSEDVRQVLRPRIGASDPDETIRPVELATHNAIADGINQKNLAALPGEEAVFEATDWAEGDFARATLDRNCIAPKTLTLKVGAQVMLLRNIDPEAGLVNGSLGKVVEIKQSAWSGTVPVVEFANGLRRELERQEWELRRNQDVQATRTQYPLRLAWAISVHKSQGLSLDKVRVHLKDCFADGQAYVAMSRARTIEGLFIANISGNSIRANQTALEFYRTFAA